MRRFSDNAVAVSGLLAVFALCACGSSADQRLPNVEIISLNGGEAGPLNAIDGPAVINLWATWCGPCRREIPDFEAIHLARRDEVTFVGINIGDDRDEAVAFLDEVGATYDQYLDPEGFVSTALKATSMPTTLVINGDGVVTIRHLGPMDQDDLDEAIDEALASDTAE
jgi:thiol-disulfide isomerase/thioredoxin